MREIISSGMAATLRVKILATTRHTMIVKAPVVGVIVPLPSQRKAAPANPLLIMTKVLTFAIKITYLYVYGSNIVANLIATAVKAHFMPPLSEKQDPARIIYRYRLAIRYERYNITIATPYVIGLAIHQY